MPAVSVVLPTYNRAYCLDRAVGSLLAQTFEDWELILVDDGSTDRTPEMRREFATALGGRYRDVDSPRQGPSGARNVGLTQARGEWIAFLDSDDVWLPEKLDLQLAALQANPAAGFCYTDFFEFDDTWRILHPRHLIPSEMEGHIYPRLLEISSNLITCPSVVARRDLLVSGGGFDESMKVCEDIDMWGRLARQTPVAVVRIPLTGVHSRHDRRFPYAESMRGRHMLYRAAASRDRMLAPDFVSRLYEEALDTYLRLARMKGDHSEAHLFESGRQQLARLDGRDSVAVDAMVDELVNRLCGHRAE